MLANTTQIYPEDRGTNYATVMADRAVAELKPAVPAAVS